MRSDDEFLTSTAFGSFWCRDSFDDRRESIDVARPVVEKLLVDVMFLDDLVGESIRRKARLQRDFVWILDVTHELVICEARIDRDNNDIYLRKDGSFIV